MVGAKYIIVCGSRKILLFLYSGLIFTSFFAKEINYAEIFGWRQG